MARVWRGAVFALVVLGVAAALARAFFIHDLASRAEPSRVAIFHALGVVDPIAETRLPAATDFDRPYGAHPIATLLHVLPGAAFIAFGFLQFSSRFRARHLQLHRIAGRCLVIAAIAGASSALFFGLLMPFAGNWERAAVSLFGAWWLVSSVIGYRAIRRHDQASHRRWMIRGFAAALSVSFIRVISIGLGLWLTPAGYTTRTTFLLSLWSGWIIGVVAAEAWIRLPLHATDHDARDVVAL